MGHGVVRVMRLAWWGNGGLCNTNCTPKWGVATACGAVWSAWRDAVRMLVVGAPAAAPASGL